jgi:hypothetical protein
MNLILSSLCECVRKKERKKEKLTFTSFIHFYLAGIKQKGRTIWLKSSSITSDIFKLRSQKHRKIVIGRTIHAHTQKNT